MLKNYVRIYSGECILEKHAPVSITRTQEMIDYMLKKKTTYFLLEFHRRIEGRITITSFLIKESLAKPKK